MNLIMPFFKIRFYLVSPADRQLVFLWYLRQALENEKYSHHIVLILQKAATYLETFLIREEVPFPPSCMSFFVSLIHILVRYGRVRDVCLVKERLCAKVTLSKCQIIHRCIRLLRFLFLLCIVIFFVIFSYSMNTVNIFLNKYCPLTGSNQRSLVSKVTTLPVEQHNHFYVY